MARKILLADDSVTAQNMGRRILSDAGYDVTTVNNGSAALKKIAEHKPDLIVLDVYMPGYGGLEVCQRLKENRETARIPVLLTVGKLEPFKADEARRVRADAFIIKPFEASELLTALTRLEDKIVPQPEAYKPGRFAKAIAAVDQIAEKGEGFGDSETGWKDRLKFPSAKPAAEPEPESVPTASTKFKDLDRGADFKPVEATRTFERPLPAGLPQDITPEEIAAITAAAAAFSGKTESPAPEPVATEAKLVETPAAEVQTAAPAVSAPAEPVAQEPPTATFASAPEVASSEPTVPIQEVAAIAPAEPEPGPVVSVAAEAAEVKEAPVAAVEEKTEAKVVDEPEAPADHKPADADVLAALASLVPNLPPDGNGAGMGGNGSYASASSENKEATFTVASAIAQLAGVGATAAGPRWVAEEATVESTEASLILEQEMEKALSAIAAVEAASAAAALTATASFVADIPAAPAPAEISESVPAETLATAAPSSEPSTPEAAVETSAPAAVETTPEITATTQPEQPPAITDAVAPASEAAPVEAVSTQAVAEAPVTEPKEEVALAAAAGAGQSYTESVSAPEAVAQSSAPALATEIPTPVASSQPVEPREAEIDAATAAAWEHWQHIRESVVGPELTAQVADVAAATLKEAEAQANSASEESAETEAEGDSADSGSSASASDPTAIASIVDSVLAELKPKLVEEIARKMGKEKDKKKKKK